MPRDLLKALPEKVSETLAFMKVPETAETEARIIEDLLVYGVRVSRRTRKRYKARLPNGRYIAALNFFDLERMLGKLQCDHANLTPERTISIASPK